MTYFIIFIVLTQIVIIIAWLIHRYGNQSRRSANRYYNNKFSGKFVKTRLPISNLLDINIEQLMEGLFLITMEV